jgi:hypothetical protein
VKNKQKTRKDKIVHIFIDHLLHGDVASGYMSESLIAKINKAFTIERGCDSRLFTIVKKTLSKTKNQYKKGEQ